MLLDWLAIYQKNNACHLAAQHIESAIDAVLRNPELRTKDLGGPLGTKGFTNAICLQMQHS
jgi:3-isopropylmalate dehydrogenase